MNIKIKWPSSKNILGIIAVAMACVFILVAVSNARSGAYKPKTEAAQARYNYMLQQFCEQGLKPLAAAKIDDKRAGFLEGDVDLNDLHSKESVDCASIGVEWSF